MIRIPTWPRTIVDHIRRRRLELKMLQRKAAERLGVDNTSVLNWESDKGTPDVRFMPAIITFLGYKPLPDAKSLAEQLVRHRTTLGMSREDAAVELGVDAWHLGEVGARGERAHRRVSETSEAVSW